MCLQAPVEVARESVASAMMCMGLVVLNDLGLMRAL